MCSLFFLFLLLLLCNLLILWTLVLGFNTFMSCTTFICFLFHPIHSLAYILHTRKNIVVYNFKSHHVDVFSLFFFCSYKHLWSISWLQNYKMIFPFSFDMFSFFPLKYILELLSLKHVLSFAQLCLRFCINFLFFSFTFCSVNCSLFRVKIQSKRREKNISTIIELVLLVLMWIRIKLHIYWLYGWE